MTTINEYRVTGMSCSHCESAVRSEVSKLDGIEQIEVSAATGLLVVSSASPVSASPVSDTDVIAAVDEAGYAAVRV